MAPPALAWTVLAWSTPTYGPQAQLATIDYLAFNCDSQALPNFAGCDGNPLTC